MGGKDSSSSNVGLWGRHAECRPKNEEKPCPEINRWVIHKAQSEADEFGLKPEISNLWAGIDKGTIKVSKYGETCN